jgi:hypothetical protein
MEILVKKMLIMSIALVISGCSVAKPAVIQLDPPTLAATKTTREIPATQTVSSNTPVPLIPTQTQIIPYTGPLSPDEQTNLESTIQLFVAKDSEQADLVAHRIGEEQPDMMDGPLVIAVLTQTHLIHESVKPHSLWMLDAVKDWQKVRKIFLPEEYELIRWSAAEGQSIPVFYAGDVLYAVPAAKNGLGRYFLVSRVDVNGIPWGLRVDEPQLDVFTIQETMLIDPSAEGLLRLADDGPVVYSGIMIWRRRDRSGQGNLERSLNTVLDRGGKWFVLVKPVGESVDFERNADIELHPASVIKIPLAMLVIHTLEKGDGGLKKALQEGPVGAGRNFGQLLYASLVNSEEDATGILEQYALQTIGAEKIHVQLSAWGASHTTLEPRRSTARDITGLLEGLYQKRLLSDESSQMVLDMLGVITKGDTSRLWKLSGTLPQGSKIYNKRGTLTDPVLIVADAGIVVQADGKAYILSLFGYPDGYVTYEDLDAILGDFAVAWYHNKEN